MYVTYLLWSSGVTIGLEVSEISISESDGSVDATVKILHGSISNRVTVALSTVEQSAKGEVVQDGTGLFLLHKYNKAIYIYTYVCNAHAYVAFF